MSRRPKPVPQMTTAQFEERFPIGDTEACLSYLVKRRWPLGVQCPRCGNTDLYDASSYKPFHWQCRECASQGYRFSCLTGTIFENTKKPLRDWYRVAHLMLSSKKGMSALQIQRMMGFGSYKTAHQMCHKIRAALIDPALKLGGIVEIDETYVGGKAANRKNHIPPKAIMLSLVERDGKVRSFHVANVTAQTLRPIIVTNVNRATYVMTDDAAVYPSIGREFAGHGSVNHSAEEYVRAQFWHTNTVENFFSIFKRGIMGTYHHVSPSKLHFYAAEFDLRYNTRTALGWTDMDRAMKVAAQMPGKRLTYRRPSNRASL
jgi:hypothetical protein